MTVGDVEPLRELPLEAPGLPVPPAHAVESVAEQQAGAQDVLNLSPFLVTEDLEAWHSILSQCSHA